MDPVLSTTAMMRAVSSEWGRRRRVRLADRHRRIRRGASGTWPRMRLGLCAEDAGAHMPIKLKLPSCHLREQSLLAPCGARHSTTAGAGIQQRQVQGRCIRCRWKPSFNTLHSFPGFEGWPMKCCMPGWSVSCVPQA